VGKNEVIDRVIQIVILLVKGAAGAADIYVVIQIIALLVKYGKR